MTALDDIYAIASSRGLSDNQTYRALKEAIQRTGARIALGGAWEYDRVYSDFEMKRGMDQEKAIDYARARTFISRALGTAGRKRIDWDTEFLLHVVDPSDQPAASRKTFKNAVFAMGGVLSVEDETASKHFEKKLEELIPYFLERFTELSPEEIEYFTQDDPAFHPEEGTRTDGADILDSIHQLSYIEPELAAEIADDLKSDEQYSEAA